MWTLSTVWESFFFLMIRRPPRSTRSRSSAASDVYKGQIINRPNAKNPAPYQGKYAISDTATEVRRLRSQGVSVLGVFAGEEKDLPAEKKIFGKDFAYIRDIGNFSKIVGRYLTKQLETDN